MLRKFSQKNEYAKISFCVYGICKNHRGVMVRTSKYFKSTVPIVDNMFIEIFTKKRDSLPSKKSEFFPSFRKKNFIPPPKYNPVIAPVYPALLSGSPLPPLSKIRVNQT